MIYGDPVLDTSSCSDRFASLSSWVVKNAVLVDGSVDVQAQGSLTWSSPIANFDVDVVCEEGVELRWSSFSLDWQGLSGDGSRILSNALPAKRHRLRFQKWGSQLRALVDQREVAKVAVSDVTEAYQLTGLGKVFEVSRRPIILFGDQPGLVTMQQASAVVVTPPNDLPGTVTVVGHGCSSSAVLGQFYYEQISIPR